MQFVLYCICGGIGVTTDYTVYYLGVNHGVWYQVANVFGYLSGTVVSFFLNRIITFGIRDQMIRRMFFFVGVAGVGFLVSALMLWILVGLTNLDAKIAKLITLPMVVILQFSLNRRITFSQNRRSESCDAKFSFSSNSRWS